MQAQLVKELMFSLPDQPGVLAKFSRSLSEAGIGIKGFMNMAGTPTAARMVVSHNEDEAQDILVQSGAEGVAQREVVAVTMEGETGSLAEMGERLAATSVNVHDMYVNESPTGASMIYVSTSDNAKALEVLNS